MGVEENKALIQRFVDTVFNHHEAGRIAEFTTNDELQKIAPALVEAFPDLGMKTEELIGEGDVVAIRVSATATHRGSFRGYTATGKRWRATATAWYVVRDNKIAEFTTNWDWLAIFEAIGAISWITPS